MSDGLVSDRAPAFVVQVEDTISAALAGHDGCTYHSPPQPRGEAMSLIRILLGRSGGTTRTDERGPWTCPIAGGRRTVTLELFPSARQLTPAPSRRDRRGISSAGPARAPISPVHRWR